MSDTAKWLQAQGIVGGSNAGIATVPRPPCDFARPSKAVSVTKFVTRLRLQPIMQTRLCNALVKSCLPVDGD